MSVASPAEPAQKPKEPQPAGLATATEKRSDQWSWMTVAADLVLIAMFLGLAFLLGTFPLKDADFYWHLRTGDLIRQTGKVPQVDIFTFTREGVPWIDLHWVFQIAISWLHEQGGVVGLNVAKCSVTCLAVLILITAKRREWPLPVMVLAWLPALLLLGGRMYVRPETLTLFYLSVFLAVILRWDRFPRLAFLLPVVQVAWVNSHGLFVLGPILLVFGLLDGALRFGVFAPERRRWWRTILVSSVATALACLINPYGIKGALDPLELAGTMSNPIFSEHVAELTSIAAFIKKVGFSNLPLQIHLVTMLLGCLSFLIPLSWWIAVRLKRRAALATDRASTEPAGSDKETTGRGKKRSPSARGKAAKAGPTPIRDAPAAASWQLSPFRLLSYVAFSYLSLQATRNSHQFAAVVGTITAWNFGEWAAAIRSNRQSRARAQKAWWEIPARPLAFVAVAIALLWVGSGLFFRMTGEGRTISLGEDALWFPHAAARFAGKAGMPSRFLSFHDGHAALFEYYHGPERKVYIDPRLEVAGADLYRRYIHLGNLIRKNQPGWEEQLAEMAHPVILNDHVYNEGIGGTLLRSAHWRCVWFDPIAAVFVHDSVRSVAPADTVDFAARHFRPSHSEVARDPAALAAFGKAIAKYVIVLAGEGDKIRQLSWLGLDYTRRLLLEQPDSFDGWRNLGVIELFRALPPQPMARLRSPFDPIHDLSIVRATYALRRALELAPRDALSANTLKVAYDFRLMHEAVVPLLDRIKQNPVGSLSAEYQNKMGSPPPTTWRNLSDLDQIVTTLLASGRALSAVLLLEKAYPPEHAPWEAAERIATLRLHLGEPARARAVLKNAQGVPDAAVREARIGTTFLAEGNLESARQHYRMALEAKPDLFEALYCQAVLEQDVGDAAAAFDLAKKATSSAPNDAARSAARSITSNVARFARPVMELAGGQRSESAPSARALSP
jgi:tetratricopeptide (TPR) repeat protein